MKVVVSYLVQTSGRCYPLSERDRRRTATAPRTGSPSRRVVGRRGSSERGQAGQAAQPQPVAQLPLHLYIEGVEK